MLAGLIGPEAEAVIGTSSSEAPSELFEVELRGIQEWEEVIAMIAAASIPETERKSLMTARLGQGLFKRNVFAYEGRCRIITSKPKLIW